jgi:hypothetical protein
MVKVNINGVSLYLDGYLQENLDITKERVHKDWDCVALVTGEEGSGKTTLAAECCYYLDSSFNLDRIVFNAEQFEEAVDKAEPYTAILWDEADDLGGHWANQMLMAIKKKFMRIRSKNLYIFLVTPSLFHLSIYFVMHRPLFLLDVYSDKLDRGYFRFFAKQGLKNLYIHGKKFWNMTAWHPNFRGRFTNWGADFPIDTLKYKAKKEEAVKSMIVSKDSFVKRIGGEKERIYWRLRDEVECNDTVSARLLGVDVRTVYNWKQKGRFSGDSQGFVGLKAENTRVNLPKVLSEAAEVDGVEE